MNRASRSMWLLALVSLAAPTATIACTVPVFRYALDHWPGDDYQLTVPIGALVSKVETLNQYRDHPGLNWQILEGEVDAAQLTAPARPDDVLWTGPLETEALDSLVDSPARREILHRILNGDSVVWAVVESTPEPSPFYKRIEARLHYLEQIAEIPPQDPFDPESKLGPGPELEVAFSILRVDASDPKERAFIKMLAGPKAPELLQTPNPTFAAPIFGRARALDAWTPEELDDVGIDEACLFLLGACSCQVKELNPGWDILAMKFWDRALLEVDDQRLAALADSESNASAGTNAPTPTPTTESMKPEAAPQPVTVKFSPEPEASAEGTTCPLTTYRIELLAGLATVCGLGLMILLRPR